MRLWIAFCSALVISTWAQAELIGVSRDTKLDASASAGAITDNKTAHETTFADFDQTLSAGAAASGATGSATAPQKSFVGNGVGPISANGGAASAFSGTGAASSDSSFDYQFTSTTTDLYRFLGGISRGSSGDVIAYLRDLASPRAEYLLYKEVGAITGTFADSWITDFTLQAGHTYDLSVAAISGPQQGSTNFNVKINPVPEPASMVGGLSVAGMLLVRRLRPHCS